MSFVLGGVLGSLMVSLIAGQAAQELESFLRDYLSAAQAGEIQARFWAHAVGAGALFDRAVHPGGHRAGGGRDPVLFLARGFLFSFSVAAFCRIFGPVDWRARFSCLVCRPFCGLRCCFWRDCQCLEGAYALLCRVLGDGRAPLPQGSAYWGKLALYGLGLVVCVTLECMAAPVLLKAAAQFVL